MSIVQTTLRDVRRVAFREHAAAMSDGQLLEEFSARRDEAAFEAIVRRHGPMVLGVCRRILRNAAEAEDAFQAAFLVLVRKARSAPRPALGAWLHGVAYRTALKAQSQAMRRRVREAEVGRMRRQETVADGALDDWQPLLDEELSRLSERARAAVVLCDLEGKTRREAARQLGIPEGTLSGRLTTARRLLAQRLARRGVTLAGGIGAAFLSQSAASASVPASLMHATVGAAGRLAAGEAATLVVSAKVASLTEGVVRAMFISKLRVAAAFLLAFGLMLGTGAFLHNSFAGAEAAPPDGRVKETPVFAPAKPEVVGKAAAPVKADIGREIFTLTGHKLNVSSLAFSPSGKLLATASADGTVKIWDVLNGKELRTLRAHNKVWRVAFSPTDDRVASGGDDGTVKIWDVATGKELLTFTGHQRFGSSVHALAFSPDGKRVASGNAAAAVLSVIIWDSATGRQDLALGGFGGMITGLAFSPDGKRLVSASGDRKLKLWDTARGIELAVVHQKDNLFNSVAFSGDGALLVTGNDNHTVTVWDAPTLKERITIKAHSREVTTAVFSRDGKLIASSGFDAVVNLFEAATGKLLASRRGHNREVHGVAFSPDGTRLASGDAEGVVKVWEIKSGRPNQ
ncbi:MAG: sigma-70 family RNA polymerase sigma factor [Gemmataceae bacterium]